MCLDNSRKPTEEESKTKFGYKMFEVGYCGELLYPFFTNGKEISPRQFFWNKNKSTGFFGVISDSAHKGFHTFFNKDDAIIYAKSFVRATLCSTVVYLVEVRDITEVGTQHTLDIDGFKKLNVPCFRCQKFKLKEHIW